VSVSSAIRWMQRFGRIGSAAAKPGGGSTLPLEAHAPWLLGLIAEHPDLTLDETVMAMQQEGIATQRGAKTKGGPASANLRIRMPTVLAHKRQPPDVGDRQPDTLDRLARISRCSARSVAASPPLEWSTQRKRDRIVQRGGLTGCRV
jgi:hypothetical protein